MRTTKKYYGVVVPMVTPLTGAGTVDTGAVKKIIQAFASSNISPLVLGTTGESPLLGSKESKALVRAAVAAKSAGQHIYAGLTGGNVDGQVERANAYFELGADVVVATLPSYYLLSPREMSGYYQELAGRLSGPLMIYNIKATTQMSIPLAVVEALSRLKNVWGLKDSERDLERLKTCTDAFKDRADFSFFCGWGAESARSLEWGADGIVPSTGNLVPELYRELYAASLGRDYSRAGRFQKETDAIAGIYQAGRTLGGSLAALKEMMAAMGWCQPYMKPPLERLDKDARDKIKRITLDHFKRTQQ